MRHINKKTATLITLLNIGLSTSSVAFSAEYFCPSTGNGKWVSTQFDLDPKSKQTAIQCNYENGPLPPPNAGSHAGMASPAKWTQWTLPGQTVNYRFIRYLCKNSAATCAWANPSV